MISGPLTLSQFLQTLRDRYVERDFDPDEAARLMIGAIEDREDSGEPIELTEACAHAIADADVAIWNGEA